MFGDKWRRQGARAKGWMAGAALTNLVAHSQPLLQLGSLDGVDGFGGSATTSMDLCDAFTLLAHERCLTSTLEVEPLLPCWGKSTSRTLTTARHATMRRSACRHSQASPLVLLPRRPCGTTAAARCCGLNCSLSNGHRHVTMLVYLNSVPDERGGHTEFPRLNLLLSPLAHSAIVFNDCLPNGEEDPRTLHGGNPPSNHTKIAINIWIRVGSPLARWPAAPSVRLPR